MSVITGSVKLGSSIVDSLAAGATRPVQVQFPLTLDSTSTYADGAASRMCNKAYYFSGSAVATPTIINLSTVVCTDGTTGFVYIREILVANDDTVDTHVLTYGAGTTPFTPELGGTTPTFIIQPGTAVRLVSKPLGALGHAVSTNINLKFDPGAVTVPFRVWIFGSS